MIRLTKKNQIEPYLSDASQFAGSAEGVFLPENEKEIAELLKEANATKIPVTVSGGRTGLVGAAVPQGGWVLSTEKLSRILEIKKGGESWARLEPAVFLKNLDHVLESQSLFYPPDPTGPKAFLGGTVSTNASGPNSFKYGSTRRFIRRLRMVLADGEILDLRRGQVTANREGVLKISAPRGRNWKIPLPHYNSPEVKHAGGYFAQPGMDALDLFIGSEGTLGVVTEIEAALFPRPREVLAFVIFFKREEDAWRMADEIRKASVGARPDSPLHPRMIEYFDSGALDFLRPNSPQIPKKAGACVFIEEEEGEAGRWQQFFEKQGALVEIWEGVDPEKRDQFRGFRSALPLAVKDFLKEHHQVKVGTDTCVPREKFEELMLFHREQVQEIGVPSVTFGHLGECHVHLNLLPRNDEEAREAQTLYPKLVTKAMELGGTFSAEHGVGKLKRHFLTECYGPKAIEEMAQIKRIFDPHLILGRGNVFEIQ